jgi:hypothetical protein
MQQNQNEYVKYNPLNHKDMNLKNFKGAWKWTLTW